LVLSRVRLIRVKLVLVNLNPINDTYTSITTLPITHGWSFNLLPLNQEV